MYGIVLILFSSCLIQTKESNLLYDIEIDYLSTPIEDNRPLPHDSILICFAGNYCNDTVDVFVNNKLYNTSIRTTDERDGIAGDLLLPNYMDIKNFGIRINNGKLIYLEPEKKHYNILLIYESNKATVRFYRKLPGFE